MEAQDSRLWVYAFNFSAFLVLQRFLQKSTMQILGQMLSWQPFYSKGKPLSAKSFILEKNNISRAFGVK